MIRILHLTDFHLNNKTLKDWNDFMKAPFLKKIKEINDAQNIDLVVFTGDLIDKSGVDFKEKDDTDKPATKSFKIFKDEIINPILEILNLDISRFIICP